jgi:hypothetical protein
MRTGAQKTTVQSKSLSSQEKNYQKTLYITYLISLTGVTEHADFQWDKTVVVRDTLSYCQ